MLKLATLIIAAALTPTLAAAETTDRVTVIYQDLDLASASGKAVLAKRIKRAAHAVCPAVEVRDLASLRRTETCVAAAIERASAQVTAAAARQSREAQRRSEALPTS